MSNEYLDWQMESEFEEAYQFANLKHNGQKRKNSDIPYICHPIAVSDILCNWMVREDNYNEFSNLEIHHLRLVALLHDTVEDTDTTFEEIEEKFGENVKNGVYWLTDQSKPTDGKRIIRKLIDLHHILQAPIQYIIVKLADVYNNCMDIVDTDISFAPKYLKEKQQLISCIKQKIDNDYDKNDKWWRLLKYANDICNQMLLEQMMKLNNS